MLGGNKSLLFNAEYLINIAGPVRLVLFADAGQVRDTGEKFGWKEPVIQRNVQGPAASPTAFSTRSTSSNPLTSTPTVTTQQVGRGERVQDVDRRRDPVLHAGLNVPFRLIFAMNPSRGGVLDNNLQPEKKYKFRFAVGSTF